MSDTCNTICLFSSAYPIQGHGVAGAYPSNHKTRSGVQVTVQVPGQVTSLSQGLHRETDNHSYLWAILNQSLVCGRKLKWNPESIHADTGKTCTLHTEKLQPVGPVRPRTFLLWGVLTTVATVLPTTHLLVFLRWEFNQERIHFAVYRQCHENFHSISFMVKASFDLPELHHIDLQMFLGSSKPLCFSFRL